MHAQAAQVAQGSNQGKKDIFQELERLGSLKQQGLITEEEFLNLKMQLLSQGSENDILLLVLFKISIISLRNQRG
jgi:hypothetical protein